MLALLFCFHLAFSLEEKKSTEIGEESSPIEESTENTDKKSRNWEAFVFAGAGWAGFLQDMSNHEGEELTASNQFFHRPSLTLGVHGILRPVTGLRLDLKADGLFAIPAIPMLDATTTVFWEKQPIRIGGGAGFRSTQLLIHSQNVPDILELACDEGTTLCYFTSIVIPYPQITLGALLPTKHTMDLELTLGGLRAVQVGALEWNLELPNDAWKISLFGQTLRVTRWYQNKQLVVSGNTWSFSTGLQVGYAI